MEIFSVNAPKYWAKGISVIPLNLWNAVNARGQEVGKAPLLTKWTKYCTELPTQAEQDLWTTAYVANNIGLALGSQSNIMVVDVDSIDPKVEEALLSVLPPSPWKRIGQKGFVLAYRFNGNRGFKISDANNKMIVEVLSTGNQVVLPPSIHPKTKQPYQANCELVDVYDQLIMLPVDIEQKIRAVLSSVVELSSSGSGKDRVNLSEYVPLGGRDVKATQMAGFYARAIWHGDMTFKEAISDMQVKCEAFMGKVDGDNIDVQKFYHKIVEFLMSDVTTRGKVLPPGWDAELTPEDKIYWKLNITEDQEEWTFAQLNDYIHAQFNATTGPNDPKRIEIVNYVLKKLSVSVKLSETEKGSILQTLKKASGLGLPISHYNRELKRLTSGPINGANHAEIATEFYRIYRERHGEIAMWNHDIWRWEGTHWNRVPDSELIKIIIEEFGHLEAAKRASDHKGILTTLRHLLPQTIKPVAGLRGVNFQNGFLNKYLELVPHDMSHGMTYILPFEYRPEKSGQFPMFQQFLNDVWGKHDDCAEKIRMLQEALAVTLLGMAPEYQKAFLLYGLGDNGKSVILDMIQAFMPPGTTCSIGPAQFNEKFKQAMFTGSLLNFAGELPDSKRIDGEAFKKVISGDSMTVEKKNKDPYDMRPTAAHWFASNHLPKTTDASYGFNRRWIIFDFTEVIPDDKKIRNLGQKMGLAESEAIVAWALQSVPMIMKNGALTESKTSKELVERMALSNSPIRQWVADRVINREGAETHELDLFQDFRSYTMQMMSGRVPPGAVFHTELIKIFMEQKRYQEKQGPKGPIFINISLKDKR